MLSAIIFDCEFLTNEDAPRRFWMGPADPDPVIAQIGAAKVSLADNFDILEEKRIYVRPIDRFGKQYALHPFFTHLTGIDEKVLSQKGTDLASALLELDAFSGGAPYWSWGKDELNMLGVSCYIAGVPPVIPARRFDNICRLMLKAGMPQEDLNRVRSNTVADYYGIEHPPLRGHDALDDALSVAYTIQHLLRASKLDVSDLLPE
jgi:DNA polymerase III epsilon subunit-like protein